MVYVPDIQICSTIEFELATSIQASPEFKKKIEKILEITNEIT